MFFQCPHMSILHNEYGCNWFWAIYLPNKALTLVFCLTQSTDMLLAFNWFRIIFHSILDGFIFRSFGGYYWFCGLCLCLQYDALFSYGVCLVMKNQFSTVVWKMTIRIEAKRRCEFTILTRRPNQDPMLFTYNRIYMFNCKRNIVKHFNYL